MTTIMPKDEYELSAAVRQAVEAHDPLSVLGGGTRGEADGLQERARRLSVAALSGVSLYEPGALTLIAAAGTPLRTIEDLLASEGQALPFEPMDHRVVLGSEGEPTVGGMVATNASGPRRIFAGACRDHILGVRFVDGRGRMLRSGGRVMKNVTGLDLGKLLCGARGTLGILTEVALKVLPAPEHGLTLAYSDRTEEAAVRLFCDALRTPYEVSGAAWRDGTAYLRIEGSEAQISHRRVRLLALFGDTEVLAGDAHSTLWRDLRDVRHFAGPGDLWRIGVKPTDAPRISRVLRDQLGAQVSLDWGGGLIWANGTSLSSASVREIVGAAGGRATQVRGRAEPDAAFATSSRPAALVEALRARFDPAQILSPGFTVD